MENHNSHGQLIGVVATKRPGIQYGIVRADIRYHDPRNVGFSHWKSRAGSLQRRDLMPEQLLTLEQVAEYLNVDKFTVYRLLAEKELPAFKVGNQWRFKRKLIETWLLKHANVRRKNASQRELIEDAKKHIDTLITPKK